ncbi:MAG: hypothetical protein LCH81_02050 [Bacteroidetes bacterium]|nr:hypothetical protein [Bacteroidota bacterium]
MKLILALRLLNSIGRVPLGVMTTLSIPMCPFPPEPAPPAMVQVKLKVPPTLMLSPEIETDLDVTNTFARLAADPVIPVVNVVPDMLPPPLNVKSTVVARPSVEYCSTSQLTVKSVISPVDALFIPEKVNICVPVAPDTLPPSA